MMTDRLADSPYTWAELLQIWSELDVPQGWRAELTAEAIVMSPPPMGRHNLIAGTIAGALMRATGEEFGVFQRQAVAVPSLGGVFTPDLCVTPRAVVPLGPEPILAQHVVLAVEITSRGTAERDQGLKKRAYACGMIPQYLLVDLHDDDGAMASLFSNPVDGTYRDMVGASFGQKITLAAPVAVVLHTDQFPPASA